jgi:hypothetical protein
MPLGEEHHELRYIPVDELFPNSWNPQTQSEEVFQRLVDEVKEGSTGFIDVIQVVAMEDGTYRILGGEHRWMAAKAADIEEVPCIVLQGEKWKDEDLQKFVTARLNAIRGKLDPEKFLKLYNEMQVKYGRDALQGLLGFTDNKAFSKLVDGAKKSMRASLPKGMADEFDKQAKEAKTVQDLQNIIQGLFTKYGDTVKHSFMVFTAGKQDHVYIQASTKSMRSLRKIMTFCQETGSDINLVIEPILAKGAKGLAVSLADSRSNLPDPLLTEEEPEKSLF